MEQQSEHVIIGVDPHKPSPAARGHRPARTVSRVQAASPPTGPATPRCEATPSLAGPGLRRPRRATVTEVRSRNDSSKTASIVRRAGQLAPRFHLFDTGHDRSRRARRRMLTDRREARPTAGPGRRPAPRPARRPPARRAKRDITTRPAKGRLRPRPARGIAAKTRRSIAAEELAELITVEPGSSIHRRAPGHRPRPRLTPDRPHRVGPVVAARSSPIHWRHPLRRPQPDSACGHPAGTCAWQP